MLKEALYVAAPLVDTETNEFCGTKISHDKDAMGGRQFRLHGKTNVSPCVYSWYLKISKHAARTRNNQHLLYCPFLPTKQRLQK